MMKQMMTVICSATLAACGSAPAVQTGACCTNGGGICGIESIAVG